MKKIVLSAAVMLVSVACFAENYCEICGKDISLAKKAKRCAACYFTESVGSFFEYVRSKDKNYYLYNICDHQECYREVGSQAISYTTGVPAMIGAMLIMTGVWSGAGVYNIEEFDPDPFMDALNKWGLPWEEDFDPVLVD